MSRLSSYTVLAAVVYFTLALTAVAEATTTGLASYYTMGKRTANGERYNYNGFTCAHRNLPFGTFLKVTNLRNKRFVIVRVNDRGPFVKGRVLDVSLGAARELGMLSQGVARVSYEIFN